MHPSEVRRRSLSEPTLALRYLCQRNSHSFCPPYLIAVQYITFFKLTGTLGENINFYLRARCLISNIRIFFVGIGSAKPLTESVDAVIDASLVAQTARPAHDLNPFVNGQLRIANFLLGASLHVEALDQFSHVRLMIIRKSLLLMHKNYTNKHAP